MDDGANQMAPEAGAHAMTAPEPRDPSAERELMRRVAGSTVSLAGRRVAVTALSGLSIAFVARALGPSQYGQLGAAVATFNLLLALSDFGFSLTLSRELARDDRARLALLRAAFHVQSAWAVLLTLVLVGLAIGTGLDTERGRALLVLAPAMAVSGLVGARSVFIVTYAVRRLVTIDLSVTAAQVVLMIAAAEAGFGPAGVAAAIGFGYIANSALAARIGYRIVDDGSRTRASRRRLLRKVLPVGLMGFMSQVYLTIDVVILGWLVHGSSLGDYAAASKMLTILQSTAGLAIGAALPAFAVSADRPAELSRITARVWHWLVAVATPCYAAAAIFAPLVVAIALGGGFADAATYLRILTVAGFIGVASVFLGHILVAKGHVRPLLIQNAIAIAVNVVGNLLLVPRYGVVASAWLTVLAEVIVCVGALITLRPLLPFAPWCAVSWRPGGALLAASVAAVLLYAWPVAAIAAFLAVYGLANRLLGGWPAELMPWFRRSHAVVSGRHG
jgi:O-antigen/teichoic acid export membrane protein